MMDQDFLFREGTVLDAGSGNSSLFTAPQNPGITSAFGDSTSGETDDISAYLRKLLSADETRPAFGFLEALVRRGL